MPAALTPNNPLADGPAAAQAGAKIVRKTLVLKNRRGLHCRPAALLVNTLTGFRAQATVESNGGVANARSIFELMCLAAGYGTKLTFVFTGSDADDALAAIQRLFDNNFAAAYAEEAV